MIKNSNIEISNHFYEQKECEIKYKHKHYFSNVENVKKVGMQCEEKIAKLENMMQKVEKKAYASMHEEELSASTFPRLQEEFEWLENECKKLGEEKLNTVGDPPTLRDKQQSMEKCIHEFKFKSMKYIYDIKNIKEIRELCNENMKEHEEKLKQLNKDFQEVCQSIHDLSSDLKYLQQCQKDLRKDLRQKNPELDEKIDSTNRLLSFERNGYIEVALQKSQEEMRKENILYRRATVDLYEQMYIKRILGSAVQDQQSLPFDASPILTGYVDKANTLLESIGNPPSEQGESMSIEQQSNEVIEQHLKVLEGQILHQEPKTQKMIDYYNAEMDYQIATLVADASDIDFNKFKEYKNKIDSYNEYTEKREEAKEIIHNFKKSYKKWHREEITDDELYNEQKVLNNAIRVNPLVKWYLEHVTKQQNMTTENITEKWKRVKNEEEKGKGNLPERILRIDIPHPVQKGSWDALLEGWETSKKFWNDEKPWSEDKAIIKNDQYKHEFEEMQEAKIPGNYIKHNNGDVAYVPINTKKVWKNILKAYNIDESESQTFSQYISRGESYRGWRKVAHFRRPEVPVLTPKGKGFPEGAGTHLIPSDGVTEYMDTHFKGRVDLKVSSQGLMSVVAGKQKRAGNVKREVKLPGDFTIPNGEPGAGFARNILINTPIIWQSINKHIYEAVTEMESANNADKVNVKSLRLMVEEFHDNTVHEKEARHDANRIHPQRKEQQTSRHEASLSIKEKLDDLYNKRRQGAYNDSYYIPLLKNAADGVKDMCKAESKKRSNRIDDQRVSNLEQLEKVIRKLERDILQHSPGATWKDEYVTNLQEIKTEIESLGTSRDGTTELTNFLKNK